jgi:ankyrin repeat protein
MKMKTFTLLILLIISSMEAEGMFWKRDRSGQKCDALIAAIVSGDVNEIGEALKEGADANCVDKAGVPALIVAVSHRKNDAVKLLLSNGANPNTTYHNPEQEMNRAPAIVFPAANGDVDILNSLLSAGADVDGHDSTGATALMAAAVMGNDKIVEVLLERGAKIEARDESGYTPLMFASNAKLAPTAGRLRAVKALLAKGAQVNAKDKSGSTPLMFAAQDGDDEVVKVLLAHGADPEVKGKHGLSAIGFAEQNKHFETLKILRDSLRK